MGSKIEKMNSTLEKDREEYDEVSLKKRNRSERLRRNVFLLKVYQRIIINEQLSLANQNIVSLLNLKDEKIYNEYLEFKIENKNK